MEQFRPKVSVTLRVKEHGCKYDWGQHPKRLAENKQTKNHLSIAENKGCFCEDMVTAGPQKKSRPLLTERTGFKQDLRTFQIIFDGAQLVGCCRPVRACRFGHVVNKDIHPRQKHNDPDQ